MRHNASIADGDELDLKRVRRAAEDVRPQNLDGTESTRSDQ
jgi:hypothetical protein